MNQIKEAQQAQREQFATQWLQQVAPKLQDMTDLLIAQEARAIYIKKGSNFKLSVSRAMAVAGTNKNNTTNRLRSMTNRGIFDRTWWPQGSAEQHQGYRYRLAGV